RDAASTPYGSRQAPSQPRSPASPMPRRALPPIVGLPTGCRIFLGRGFPAERPVQRHRGGAETVDLVSAAGLGQPPVARAVRGGGGAGLASGGPPVRCG